MIELALIASLVFAGVVALNAQLDDVDREIIRCKLNFNYFTHNHVQIKSDAGEWVPFRLWSAQADVGTDLTTYRLIILLKARQLGMSWLLVSYAVWVAIFEPGSTVLLFSKGQREAKELLARIRDVIIRLPVWMQPRKFLTDGATELTLSNGSRFVSFASASSGGDSYTARLVIIDEADLIRDLNLLLSGAKPTVDGGGQLVLLSRTEKSDPESPFKRTYRAAAAGELPYHTIFLPWHARPERDQDWYDAQKAEILGRTGWLDELYANYPATAEEALAAKEQDKRFPLAWLEACFREQPPLSLADTPFAEWSGIEIYALPVAGREYSTGVDVALGNPTSDDSVAIVTDALSCEEVCVLCGKFEPTVLAQKASEISRWYNNARLHVERNNHGHKCLEAMLSQRPRPNVLKGRDKKPGWWTDPVGKTFMYDTVAECLRRGACIIRSRTTFNQLASLDAIRQEAPEGRHDDRAVGYGLSVLAATKPVITAGLIVVTTEEDKPPSPKSSKNVGVTYYQPFDQWEGFIVDAGGARISLGTFETEAEAAHSVNFAFTRLGKTPPNTVKPLDPGLATEIGKMVAKTLTERGL